MNAKRTEPNDTRGIDANTILVTACSACSSTRWVLPNEIADLFTLYYTLTPATQPLIEVRHRSRRPSPFASHSVPRQGYLARRYPTDSDSPDPNNATHRSYGLTLGRFQRYKSCTRSRVFAVSGRQATAPRVSPLCESGGTGRRARLRISWATVGVQVPPLAPLPRYCRGH
jgi:hypothetical protein